MRVEDLRLVSVRSGGGVVHTTAMSVSAVFFGPVIGSLRAGKCRIVSLASPNPRLARLTRVNMGYVRIPVRECVSL